MSSPEPRISVALPVFNGMPELKWAMEGLLNQTYRNFKVVVQDSLSDDGSLEYLRSIADQVDIDIVSEKDGSLGEGYRRCLLRCDGDLVVIAACDERLDDDAFEKYARWHSENPNAVYVFSSVRMVDVNGRVLQHSHTKGFDLMDFLRHQAGPSMAGFFNRKVLGDELRYDPEMETCPDFEFVSRIALKFGPENFVCKPDITLSARGDNVSSSLRPELYKYFATYKGKVIDRIIDGPLRPLFDDYVRRDLRFQMYTGFAHMAFGLGAEDEYVDLTMMANDYLPGHRRTLESIDMGRMLSWDEQARKLVVDRAPQPEAPPADAVVKAQIVPDGITAYEYWLAVGGASLWRLDDAVRITSSQAYSYGGLANIDFSQIDFDTEHCWLKVRVRDTRGDMQMSLFNPQANEIMLETGLRATPLEQEAIIMIPGPIAPTLLFRAGSTFSVTTFLGAELVTAPKPKIGA